MRILSLAAACLLVASTAVAQKSSAPPKLAPCDTAGVLAKAQPVFNAGVATLKTACPAFDKALADFVALNPLFADAVNRIRHGVPAAPPKDTAIVAPPVTPVDTTHPSPPVDTTKTPPKDSTPGALPAVNSWTRLGAGGNQFTFTGLHVARWTLGDSAKASYILAYGILKCGDAKYGNDFVKVPTGGNGVGYCEIGPTIYDTLKVPQKMGPITSDYIVVPRGSPGVDSARVRASGGEGIKTDGTGSSRQTSMLSKFIFDDPIVYPGTTGVSHLHMLFGNTAVTGYTNSAQLASSGNSTTIGGILNRTAYWTPAMVDKNGNVVMPDVGTFYYKSGQWVAPSTIQTLPVGLKMIAGDKNATGKQFSNDGKLQTITWTCLNGTASSPGDMTIPNCKVGDAVRLTAIFPQCWDGKNLDSPDHKSHMAYPNYTKAKASLCPSDHPVPLPEITEHFDFPVLAGATPSTWHLSSDMDMTKPGGLSAHADWMNGWDPPTFLSIVQNCFNPGLDCEIGGLGKKILYH